MRKAAWLRDGDGLIFLENNDMKILKNIKWFMFILGGLVFIAGFNAFCSDSEESSKFIYDSHGRRDPFVPVILDAQSKVVSEGQENISFLLEGIIWEQDGKAVVIINDTILGEHDYL